MSTPLTQPVQAAAGWVGKLRAEIGRVIVGQEQLVERLLVGLLANGHVLLEGVPGLAKTMSVRTLATAIHASFHRIQFTPDLLPADIVGTLIYIPLDEILTTRRLVDQIHVDEKVRDYIVHLVFATRKPEQYKLDLKHFIQFGASPRATIYLTLAAKAWAMLRGRAYVTPEDIKSIGPDVLRHRLILTYEAEAQAVTADAIIKKIFNAVPVP